MLKEKVCFITGSTRGIGWATANLFASHGATLILNGHSNQELLNERVETIQTKYGTSATGILADVSDPSQVSTVYRSIFNSYKRLDVLVNNAGIMQDAMVGMISEPMIRSTLAINILGPILHLQEAARLMGRRGSGSIVNLTSILGTKGGEGQMVYSSSKAAVIGMTFAAAKELAPKQIRVNAVAPGFIDTDMTRRFPPDTFAAGVAKVKMGRAGTPEDVASAILFLASDLSSYVTGQVLGVDGGMLI